MSTSTAAVRPAMLSIQQPTKELKTIIPNILPCVVVHTGPIGVHARFWKPESNPTGNYSKAYFRGRKLCSRQMTLPDGFTGIVTSSHNNVGTQHVSQDHRNTTGTSDEEEDEIVGSIEGEATFDSILVWDHEKQPEGKDHFFRGIDEWLAFADKIHNVDLPVSNAS